MKPERIPTALLKEQRPDIGAGPILVVDDSQLQRRILSSQLRRMGHEVVEAGSGAEALEYCRANRIQIVISDWMMPQMNGLQFCRALRQDGQGEYTYFILLTSKGEAADIAEGLDAGADDFLTKPVNGDELRARIVAGHRILMMQDQLQSALDELRGLYEAVDNDLIEARKLQQSLVRPPEEAPRDAEVSLCLKSSGRVGGDLVGTYPVSDTEIGIYALDVSGHGIASALLGARVAGYLSGSSPDQNIALRQTASGYAALPPHEVVGRLNEIVLGDIETELYFTICIASVDVATGQVRFCQAGHPPPALVRCDQEVEFVGQGGLPVGLIEGAQFATEEVRLDRGERLLLYSDGIVECEDAQGAFFDGPGLARSLAGHADLPIGQVFGAIMGDLKRFSGRDQFDDDISGVIIGRKG